MALFCRHLLSLILVTRLWLCASGELLISGLNVCSESFNVTLSRSIAETYISNVDCDGQQPPCQKSRYKTQYYIVPKNVLFCCIGWSRSGDECTRSCPMNTYGRGCNQTCNCINANTYCNPSFGCVCHVGYKPPNCTVPCDEGSHGYICTQKCTCLNDAACDPVNGTCYCTPGWMGDDCNTTCPVGRFGADCVGNCSCDADSMCDRATGNCSSTVTETFPPDSTKPDGTTKADMYDGPAPASNAGIRLTIIATSLVGAIVFIVIVTGVIMCGISKRYKRFVDRISGLSDSFSEPQKRGLSTRRSEDQRDNIGTDTGIITRAPTPSLEEEETNEGQHPDDERGAPPVDVHGEAGEAGDAGDAVAEAAAEAPAAPVAAGPIQAGTARRNKRDELPSTLPRPPCSWAEDENAYCELGGGRVKNPPTAPKPKPKVQTFNRQSLAGRGKETTGNASTKSPVDPIYHVLNPDHSEDE